ncbi:non-ribosomal peptide synthetase [Kutzneria sp. 744]|uniref:non-ribosomal peptide synthetase n=1 Tax=Kutzneria sp. (strain 744) TaxID=345341 RepID=UPI0004B816E2|nr:non-ribosomal peptide synthetase [Kutzneria sp. 744]
MDTARAERMRRRIALHHGIDVPVRPADGRSAATGAEDLPATFADVVRRCGDRPAVRCAGRELTYRQLDDASSRLAAAIVARIGQDTRPVAVLLDRTPEMIVAALAAVKAGAGYVPLDPSNPAGRLRLILEDAAPSLVVTASGVADLVPGHLDTLLVDEAPMPAAHEWRQPPIQPSDAAYTVFTSGTTGRPKGARVSHRSLLHLLSSTGQLLGYGPEDVWTLFHSFGFDFAIWETWGPLLSGGCVVIVPNDLARDPVELRGLLRDERVTVLNQTPKSFAQLMAEDVRHADRLPLRYVLLGGEALRFAELRPWMDKYGEDSPRLANIYGPSEATVIASYYPLSRDDLNQTRSLIGRPLPGLDFVLVDENLAPAPAGTPGEIVITGPSVALGYAGRAELTQDRFVEVPTATGGRRRGYRTGDLAVLTAGGEYEFRGRNDDQVKIRGYRVEPGEVEAVLSALDQVRKAAVVGRDVPDIGMSLVAYVVPADADLAAETLRAALAESFPEYMIPRAFVFLADLPLTDHGKLDQRALPEPVLAVPDDGVEAGAGDVEAQLLTMVKSLLHNNEVTPGTDFFTAGGHSLLVTRLLAHVESDLGVHVTLREFFRDPTVRGLSTLVRAGRKDAGAHGSSRGNPRALVPLMAPDPDNPPLTDPQSRLYFIDRLAKGMTAYHLHTTVILDGPLDEAALERAFDVVVARHAPLRTVVNVSNGRHRSQVRPHLGFRLPREDLVIPAGSTWRQALVALSAAETDRRFDLREDLMLRARLVRVVPGLAAVMLTMHHIAADGWSIAVLSRELKLLYQHFRDNPGGESPLAPLRYGYPDYAHSVQEWLASAEAETDIGYWIRRLDGLPEASPLPPDKPRPEQMTYRGAATEVVLADDAADRLRRLCQEQNTTLFMVMEAALAVLLVRRGAAPDVAFGSAVANRPFAELDELIGMFVNTLVSRITVRADESFQELLGRVRGDTLDDLEHQHVPFDVVVKRLNPRRSSAAMPLFQIMIIVQNNEPVTLELDEIEATSLSVVEDTAKMDLHLEVFETGGRVTFRWTYNTDLFHDETIEGLATDFERLIAEVTARPDARGTLLSGAPGLDDATSASPAPTALFPLRSSASTAPAVVALPGGLGLESSFAQVAAYLTDRPCFGLPVREMVEAHGAGLTLSTLLDDCVRAVTASCPGPVHLAGHSVGGTLGFHLADALVRRGHEVRSLTLLDSPAPIGLTDLLIGSREELLGSFLSAVADAFPDAAQRWSAEKFELEGATEADILAHGDRLLRQSQLDLLDGSLRGPFEYYAAMRTLDWPEPGVLPCPALLIRATAGGGSSDVRPEEWQQCVPVGLDEAKVPATHDGLLRAPHARSVAAVMSRFLLRADVR